jgi:hypothetical protein
VEGEAVIAETALLAAVLVAEVFFPQIVQAPLCWKFLQEIRLPSLLVLVRHPTTSTIHRCQPVGTVHFWVCWKPLGVVEELTVET